MMILRYTMAGCLLGLGMLMVAVDDAGAEANPADSSALLVEQTTQSPKIFHVNNPNQVDETCYPWPKTPATPRVVSWFRITNTGDEQIQNPRLRINGFRMPLSTEELENALIKGSADTRDQVLRVFYAIYNYAQHRYPVITKMPLDYFLTDLSGDCACMMLVQERIWSLLGLRHRNSHAICHAVSEVEVGGRTLHLDSNLQAFYLLHDNWTIASAQDLRDDPWLVRRATHYRDFNRYPRLLDDPELVSMWYSSSKVAALFGPRAAPPPLRNPDPVPARVQFSLRPGESYGWDTATRRLAHPSKAWPELDAVSRDITWTTELDFARPSHRWPLRPGQLREVKETGIASLSTTPTLSLEYRLPFPIIGGSLQLIGTHPQAELTALTLWVRYHHPKSAEVLRRYPLQDAFDGTIQLDNLLGGLPYPQNRMQLALALDSGGGDTRATSPAQLRGIRVNLTLRSTIWACRGLRSGGNEIIYTDDSPSRQVIVEAGAEPDPRVPPVFSPGDFFPPDDSTVPEAELAFRWPECLKQEADGFHLQISAHADMRYPLSPTFDRLVRSRDLSNSDGYRLPWPGLLPVGRTLYWRVRPVAPGRLAGTWSEPRAFRVAGPEPPGDLKAHPRTNLHRVNPMDRVTLSWSATQTSGTLPVYYEIHASTTPGFSPVDKSHRILGLSDSSKYAHFWGDVYVTDWPVVPSTLLTTTTQTSVLLFDPQTGEGFPPEQWGPHLRVIAVDANGSRSASSPVVHLRSPLLPIPPEVIIPAGEFAWSIPAIRSDGRILNKDCYHLGLWNRPKLNYYSQAVSPAANNWKVDSAMGVLHGRISPGEEVALKIIVSDEKKQSDTRMVKFRGAGGG